MYSTLVNHDIAIHVPSNTLTCVIEERLRKEQSPFENESKSSTESESDCKMKLSSFSSTDTIAPLNITNQELLHNLEFSNTKEDKLLILRVILESHFDSVHYWDLLKLLQENLNDSDEQIFKTTVEIHKKLINSSWETLKDAFINLLETLYVYYFSLSTNVLVDQYPYRNVFRIYRLVLDTLNEVCLHAPNIGHSRLEKIIGNFVDLVFFTTKIHESLSPLNIISCLDPEALWCKILLHSVSTRSILFKCMKRNTNLLKYVFLVISDWICEPFTPKSNVICYSSVKYTTFLNSIRCCSYFSRFKSFYTLFPIIIGSKMIVSLNSFAMSLIAFLKSKPKIPEIVATCMVDCTACLLKFQPTDYLVSKLQLIVDALSDAKHRKYLFEVVEKLLQDKMTLRRAINQVICAKRVSPSGQLLKRVSSTNNVFASLMNVIVAELRNNSQSTAVWSIVENLFQCHEFLVVCGPDSYMLTEFVELLGSKFALRMSANCRSADLTPSNDNCILSVGCTPLGFYHLSRSDSLAKLVTRCLERKGISEMSSSEKKMLSFMSASECRPNLRGVYKKTSVDLLELVYRLMECGFVNESEFRDNSEKILVAVDTLSYNLSGIHSVMNYVRSGGTYANEVTSFVQFIDKYALHPTYEYDVQRVALQSLDKMIRNFSLRVYLICLLDYEECLLNVQNTCLTETGKVINDECSILRTEMLTGWFSYYHPITNRSNWKLSRKKLSDIEKFLQKTRHGPYDNNWLKHARKAYKASLMYDIKLSVVLELIEKSAKSSNKAVTICKLSVSPEDTSPALLFEDSKGVSLAVKYAARNHILHENSINEENLAQLIKTIRTFVGYHDSRYFTGFDCILATIFIMSEGSLERCLHIASCLIPLPISAFIWPQVTPTSFKKRYLFGHLLEWLLYQEVPTVFHALLNYEISWWLICKNQLDNCFWNTMPWIEICRWFCMTVLHSADNLIYFFTSVAYKNETRILRTTDENELRDVLHVIFGTCQLAEHMPYIDHLSKKYNLYLSSYLSN